MLVNQHNRNDRDTITEDLWMISGPMLAVKPSVLDPGSGNQRVNDTNRHDSFTMSDQVFLACLHYRMKVKPDFIIRPESFLVLKDSNPIFSAKVLMSQ
jgi:hypothetical protein